MTKSQNGEIPELARAGQTSKDSVSAEGIADVEDEERSNMICMALEETSASWNDIDTIYKDLRRLAAGIRLKEEGPEYSLQGTEIANEVYLRINRTYGAGFWKRDKASIIGIFRKATKNYLMERARNKRRQKRPTSGKREDIEVLDSIPIVDMDDDLLEAVNKALDKLRYLHPRQSEVVELRLLKRELPEIAELLSVHENTVKNDWKAASLFLKRECDLSGAGRKMEKVDWQQALDRFLHASF